MEIINWRLILASFSLSLLLLSCKSLVPLQVEKLNVADNIIPAHAHNDYRNKKPLEEALSLGFQSIEVDVHLIKGELYVSHLTPLTLNKNKTLELMYLEPLSRAKFLQDPLILLIDVKTDALKAYHKLKEVLGQYRSDKIIYVISGGRAIDQILEDSSRLMTIDGRPDDVSKNYKTEYMPLISQNYKRFFSKRDPSKIDLKEIDAFKALVNEVHRQGKIIRLWASPDNEEMWRFLLNLKVDLINTDNPEAFYRFYNNDKQGF